MDAEDVLQDAEAALEDVQRLRGEILELPELAEIQRDLSDVDELRAEDLEQSRTRIQQLLDRIERLISDVMALKGRSHGDGASFRLATLANELNTELYWLQGILEHMGNLVGSSETNRMQVLTKNMARRAHNALAHIRSFIIPRLKRVLAKIWQIISNLLTPKEWKIQGKVGGGLLGLADVGVEIAFGV